MTIKEVCELTGKAKNTIYLWCSKIEQASSKIEQAKKTNIAADFTLDETVEILRAGKISEPIIEKLKIKWGIVNKNDDNGFMTVKQIAELVNVTIMTIHNWIKTTPYKNYKVENGKESKFTLEETIEILRAGKTSEGIINLLIENANKSKSVEEFVTKTDLIEFGKILVSETIKQLVPVLPSLLNKNNQLQISSNKELDIEYSPRELVQRTINKYVGHYKKRNHAECYRELWETIRLKENINVTMRLENYNKTNSHKLKSKLDYAENSGDKEIGIEKVLEYALLLFEVCDE